MEIRAFSCTCRCASPATASHTLLCILTPPRYILPFLRCAAQKGTTTLEPAFRQPFFRLAPSPFPPPVSLSRVRAALHTRLLRHARKQQPQAPFPVHLQTLTKSATSKPDAPKRMKPLCHKGETRFSVAVHKSHQHGRRAQIGVLRRAPGMSMTKRGRDSPPTDSAQMRSILRAFSIGTRKRSIPAIGSHMKT